MGGHTYPRKQSHSVADQALALTCKGRELEWRCCHWFCQKCKVISDASGLIFIFFPFSPSYI